MSFLWSAVNTGHSRSICRSYSKYNNPSRPKEQFSNWPWSKSYCLGMSLLSSSTDLVLVCPLRERTPTTLEEAWPWNRCRESGQTSIFVWGISTASMEVSVYRYFVYCFNSWDISGSIVYMIYLLNVNEPISHLSWHNPVSGNSLISTLSPTFQMFLVHLKEQTIWSQKSQRVFHENWMPFLNFCFLVDLVIWALFMYLDLKDTLTSNALSEVYARPSSAVCF